MRFELKAKCVFNRELEQAEVDIKEMIERAEPLLLKGAPRGKETEAAKVAKWWIAGKTLELEIESGRYVRAHDALFRLTKLLGQKLGKKYRLGIREIRALEYRIRLPFEVLTEHMKRRISDLPCRTEIGDREMILTLHDVSEADFRDRVIDRLVSIAEEILAQAPVPTTAPKIVRKGKPIEHPFNEDPFEVAKRLRWIIEFPGRGQWIYGAPYTKLLRTIENLIIERVANPLGFEEVMFPKLIPLEVMQRMPGYLDGMPEGMYYVCSPPREPEAFARFKQKLKLTKKVPTKELEQVLKPPAYVLAPAQCEPFYQIFGYQGVKLEDTPIKFLDRSGWTYRWEGGGTEGFIRTHEFMRIEFAFLGIPDDVVKIRDEVLDKSIALIEELELEWQILAATPFYMREGGVETDISDSRKIATYDLEVSLPYKNGWLELGSYNVHRTKFVETFKIKEAGGREIWTGCCGFGITRWVAGFLAQHGFDIRRWPHPVKKLIEPISSV